MDNIKKMSSKRILSILEKSGTFSVFPNFDGWHYNFTNQTHCSMGDARMGIWSEYFSAIHSLYSKLWPDYFEFLKLGEKYKNYRKFLLDMMEMKRLQDEYRYYWDNPEKHHSYKETKAKFEEMFSNLKFKKIKK